MLPPLHVVARRRPVALVAPTGVVTVPSGTDLVALAQPAPYVAVQADLRPTTAAARVVLRLVSSSTDLRGELDLGTGTVGLSVSDPGGRTSRHRSRRFGRATLPVDAVALSLTGTWLTAWARERGRWTARGRVHLEGRVPTRDEGFVAGLRAGCVVAGADPVSAVRAGGFGQVGLRDLRVVTHATGGPVREDGRLLLTATSAGPGFFDTGHTSVWALDEGTLALEHRADLFFRRPDRPGVFGDHATHLVRDAGRWLVATSTWGDFRATGPDAGVAVTVAETRADLRHGRHVLDTRLLRLPTEGLRSVGVWDPHLVRTDDGWLVGYVSARRFFRFHPVLAAGPDLGHLALRSADPGRVATEGTTLLRVDGQWLVLASDGPDGHKGQRTRFPVFDLDLREVGTLRAPYPSNLPWPSLVHTDQGWLMVTFDGRGYGGPLPGYGTHGDVVLLREQGAGGDPAALDG